MSRYRKIHPKIRYVERAIEQSQKRIDSFIKEFPDSYEMAMVGEDGRRELSYEDVEAIYSRNDRNIWNRSAPFNIIVELDYYQWLLWFQNEVVEDKAITYEVYYENADFYQSIYVNEERNGSEAETYMHTWSSLFKDPQQSDTIISLLKGEGYISESCTWLQFPEQLTMIALYLTLSRRGYLRNIPFSAQTLSNAFNAQFNMNFGSKQWSPSKRTVAEQYIDLFNLIPWLR